MENVEEEKFDLHMRFIGSDLNYWEKLKERFERAYDSLKIKYSLINPQIDKFNPMNEYISLIEDDVNILFYETIYDHQKSIDFIKFVRRDQKTKRISTTVLHSFNATDDELSRMTTAGARINQINSDEFSGVIFAAMAMYDANKTEIPPLLFVSYEKDIELIQELRLSFLTKDYYSVETNSPFIPGTELEFEVHPYSGLLPPNCKFEVRSLSEENLYYYNRYNLKLWPILEEPKSYERRIQKWISSTDDKMIPKKTKILLIDPYLKWFKGIDKSIKNLEFTVNFQTQVDLIDNVLRRRRPLIICLAIDDQDPNSIISARRLITKVNATSNYEPYILIVNCPVPTETLKKSLNYEKVMGIRNLLNPAEIQSMAQSLEKKLLRLEDDEQEKRTYFKSSNSKVKINYHRRIRLLGMTESMIYFQSDQVIPDYTVFTIDHPVHALLTTVPHFKVELKELPKPYYIGIINCTGESANSKLRNYLNTLIKESQEPDEPEQSKENEGEDSSSEPEEN